MLSHAPRPAQPGLPGTGGVPGLRVAPPGAGRGDWPITDTAGPPAPRPVTGAGPEPSSGGAPAGSDQLVRSPGLPDAGDPLPGTAADGPAGAVRANLERLVGAVPPLLAVAVAAVNLWAVRATRLPIAYLDDADMHEQMVRFATQSFAAGRNPLTRWFPYLNEGSPQFLHYQSLGAMITGAVGLVTGPDTAFRWSLLLLWGLWPLAIYASARIFGLGRWPSAAAAAVSPLLMSVPGVGFEVNGYLWVGYGLWAQLWGMLFLPFAWACSWRALADRRWTLPAVLAVTATICAHFETGYLALAAPMVMPWLVPGDLVRRVGRAALLMGLSFAAAAWAVAPLLIYSKWAAINEALAHGPLVNGYGAKVVLGWLVHGEVFDNGRLPVVTILVGIGTVAAVWRWRSEPLGRALVALGVFCLMLTWGPTTWGPVADLVPGGRDIFFRRFMMGTQLAGIYLVGLAASAIAATLARVVVAPLSRRRPDTALVRRVAATATIPILVALGIPALREVGAYTARNAVDIALQRTEAAPEAAQLAPLLAHIEAAGGGRTYAGDPDNWGANFDVGLVPVYKYLESQDIDEVGFTLRTAALMSQPELHFDQYQPSDFVAFGIRWLIYPSGQPLPPGYRYVMHSGPYWLYELPADGYVSVVDTVGTIDANRFDVGPVTAELLAGPMIAEHQDLTVGWAGAPAPAPTSPDRRPGGAAPGEVLREGRSLVWGRMDAVVHLRRRAVVVLSASYDPGWTATVDGRRAPVEMIAPALVGVVVGPGTHRVVFRYVGFAWYPELWGLTAVALVAAGWWGGRGRRQRHPAR